MKIKNFIVEGSIEIDIEIEVSHYYHDPGRYSGLPENCYPAESDYEIKKVYAVFRKWDGKSKKYTEEKRIELPEAMIEHIEDQIEEYIHTAARDEFNRQIDECMDRR